MSTDIRLANNPNINTTNQNNVCQYNNERIGNALGSGNVGESANKVDNNDEQRKKDELKKKQEGFNSVVNNYKAYNIKNEDALRFIEKISGYNEQAFFELPLEQFKEYVNLLENVLEFMVQKGQHLGKEKSDMSLLLDSAAEKVSKMLKNGNKVQEASNFIENFEDSSLFDILKIENPGELAKYKSLNEVPEDVLENCIKKLFVKYKEQEGTRSHANIGKSLTVFKNLLARTSPEEYKILYNAFVKVAKSEDERFAAISSTIESFKNNPSEFKKFIDEELPKFCASQEPALDVNKVKPLFLKIAKAANENGTDTIEFMNDLLNILSNDQLYENIKNKKEEERTAGEKELFGLLEKEKEILQIPEEKRTKEQKEFLENLKNNKKSYNKAIIASLMAYNQKDSKKIIDEAKKYGFSEDEILTELINISKEYDNIILDKDLLDDLTNGKFSEVYKNVEEASAKASNTDVIGLPQKNNGSSVAIITANVENKIKQLYQTTNDNNKFYVEKGSNVKTEVERSSRTHNWASLTTEDLRKQLSEKTIKFGEVLDNYKDLPDSTKLFVDDMIASMSMGMQAYFLNGIKGQNHVVIQIVKKISTNPDRLNLALDYASEKELERIKNEKAIA